jgi:FkbM family methyltransferase
MTTETGPLTAGGVTVKQCPGAMRPHLEKVLEGEYAPPTGFRLTRPPGSVLDIGANVGAFALWARAQWPEALVVAYEPMPENVELLLANVGKDEMVEVVPAAVRWHADGALMRRGRNNCGEASVYDLGEQEEEASVRVASVSASKLPRAHFVKIDAEGCEAEILQGMDLSETRAVAYEWHGEENREACREALLAAGLARVGGSTRRLDRGVEFWARVGEVKWTEEEETGPAPAREQGMKRVFLAVPVYGGVDPHFFCSMLNLVAPQDPPRSYSMRVRTLIGDSLVSRARNALAAEFLRGDCSHLLFVDSDLVFSPEHVERLLSHEVPIVAGCYPKKQRKLAWVANLLDPPGEPDARGLHSVKYAGTGFLCIAREVFEAMVARWPEIEYDPDDGEAQGPYWDFFAVGPWTCPRTGRRRYLSEDWWFCQRALDLGYEVLMDTHVVLKHSGGMVYPVDSLEEETEPATK